MSEAAVAADPTLKLVRGYYTCPMWGRKEPHWWTVRPDGTIHDPTCLQFPSGGLGTYEEFDGTFECSNCNKTIAEADAIPYSNYVFCSDNCICDFVGV